MSLAVTQNQLSVPIATRASTSARIRKSRLRLSAMRVAGAAAAPSGKSATAGSAVGGGVSSSFTGELRAVLELDMGAILKIESVSLRRSHRRGPERVAHRA